VGDNDGMAEVLPEPLPSRPPASYVARRELRVSDAERQVVVDELRTHFGAGRLDLAEFEERTRAALESRVRGDLHPLLDDLPELTPKPPVAGPPVRPKPERPRALLAHTSFRVHLYLWVALNAFLVLIWAATGGDGGFWPIWPMLGTGLPLGVHAAVRLATSSPGEHRDR